MRTARILLIGAASLALTACISMAPEKSVPAITAELPDRYPSSATPVGDYRPQAWWTSFDDPVLNKLVDRALADNLDVAQAAARVARANAQARLSRSALLPQVNASGRAQYSDTPLEGNAFGGLGGGAGSPDRIQNEAYSLSLGAAYELDLFGSARSDLAAARADAEATAFNFKSVQLAAAAETISSYFELVDMRRQIELSLRTADVLAERAEQTEDRYRRGLVDSLTLYQVRQDLRATQASLPQREKALADVSRRLALLVRDTPEQVAVSLDQALTPQLVMDDVPAGLPVALLAQRPDIGAAAARLEASRQRIGARRADRFPSLSLSASPGTQAGDPLGAFDIIGNWALSLVASVTAPIFNGGRISAQIAAERATYDEAAAAYAQVVLKAYGEVVSALQAYEEDRQRYRLLTAQRNEAAQSADTRARQFSAGVGSYSAFLDAERARLLAEANLSSGALDVVRSRLAVHRALGGDWTSAPVAPNPIDMISPERDRLENAERPTP